MQFNRVFSQFHKNSGEKKLRDFFRDHPSRKIELWGQPYILTYVLLLGGLRDFYYLLLFLYRVTLNGGAKPEKTHGG